MTEPVALGTFIEAMECNRFEGNAQSSFSIRPANDFFVDPELVAKDGLGDLAADIVLLSARGAAGKSTTGQHLSHVLGVPLWKLEDDNAVSAASLNFVLSRYLQDFEPEDAISRRHGPVILIDSLDEARARVSGTSWTEFLESLAEISRRGARLILLGRERTLEDAWLTLDDAGVNLAWFEISHFGATERVRYVDGVVERNAKREITKMPIYSATRDSILRALAGPLTGEAADSFVGYAPVLDAVATVLCDEQNLYLVSKQFDVASGGTRGLEELWGIIDGLLEREQSKVAPLAGDLGLSADAVYQPAEQIGWLCSELLGGVAPDLHSMDARTRDQYTRRVSEFLKDHPFRSGDRWASVVFAAYVAARRFTSIPGGDLLRVGNESGLLFDFFSLDGAQREVNELQFAALHASIMAGGYSGVQTAISVSEWTAGRYETAMHVVRAGESEEVRLELAAEIPGQLALYGPLEALTVVALGGVRIPARAPATVLGPDLFIRCDALAIEGSSVEFAHRAVPVGDVTQSGQVILQVADSLTLPGDMARAPLPGDFELAVSAKTALQYPWVTYRIEYEDDTSANPSGRAERFLNMLMNLTRTHGHAGDRGCFVMKLQGRQSVKGEEFKRVVATLERLGVVRVEREILYLMPQYEPHRFSGKTAPGQRSIRDVWDVWGPIVEEVRHNLRG